MSGSFKVVLSLLCSGSDRNTVLFGVFELRKTAFLALAKCEHVFATRRTIRFTTWIRGCAKSVGLILDCALSFLAEFARTQSISVVFTVGCLWTNSSRSTDGLWIWRHEGFMSFILSSCIGRDIWSCSVAFRTRVIEIFINTIKIKLALFTLKFNLFNGNRSCCWHFRSQ